MYSNVRRFVFLSYTDLDSITFKKLDKVCERLYIFIDAKVDQLPISIVRKMQRFGDQIRWISGDMSADPDMMGPISFQMGKLHAKLHPTTEFAVVSDSSSFDTLVKMIRKSGRPCLRLDAKEWALMQGVEPEEQLTEKNAIQLPVEELIPEEKELKKQIISPGVSMDEKRVQETVQETFERLIRSGNRPAEVETLKSYILIHHPEFSSFDGLDSVIRGLEATMDIQIDEGEVHYNF